MHMHTADVIVETPKESKCKYKFEKKENRFRLLKFLPPGLAFPYDFGFIPGSKEDDGGFAGCYNPIRKLLYTRLLSLILSYKK